MRAIADAICKGEQRAERLAKEWINKLGCTVAELASRAKIGAGPKTAMAARLARETQGSLVLLGRPSRRWLSGCWPPN